MLHSIYSIAPKVIINKRHKVMVTFNKCYLGAMFRGAMNFTLVFFLMTQCSQNFNLQVLAPYNKLFFA